MSELPEHTLESVLRELRSPPGDQRATVVRAETTDTVDRDKLLDVLRGAVEDEWLATLAELREGGLAVVQPWPEDERWALTLESPGDHGRDSDGKPLPGRPTKALTFATEVPYVEGAVALAKVVRRAMKGSAGTIREVADRLAPGLALLVRCPPQPVLAVNLTVHVRCRLGFLRTEPEVVTPVPADVLERQDLLTDAELAERANAALRKRRLDPENAL